MNRTCTKILYMQGRYKTAVAKPANEEDIKL